MVSNRWGCDTIILFTCMMIQSSKSNVQSSMRIHFFFLLCSLVFANGTGFTPRMTLDASGNLGLGVTPSAWSGVKAMQIGSDGSGLSLFGYSGTGAEIGSNVYFNGTNYAYGTTATATRYVLSSGQHRWFIAPSGTQDSAISFTQAMTLTNSGDTTLTINVTGSNNPRLNFSGGAGVINRGTASNALYFGETTDSGSYSFRGSGGLEVGYSAIQGAYKLDVNGTGRFSGNLRLETGASDGLIIFRNNASGNPRSLSYNVADASFSLNSTFTIINKKPEIKDRELILLGLLINLLF